jgi:hypothetical protein
MRELVKMAQGLLLQAGLWGSWTPDEVELDLQPKGLRGLGQFLIIKYLKEAEIC